MINLRIGNWQTNTIISVAVTIIAGGYFLGITHDIFSFVLDPLINYKLDFFPILSVKNALGAGLLWLALKIGLHQVD